MNPVILIELAKKWDAKPPEFKDGSEQAKLDNARAEGLRAATLERFEI